MTRKRALSALQNAMNELAVDQAVLVTMNDSEEIRLQSGTVNVLPAWRFLLELDYPGDTSTNPGLISVIV